MRKVFDLFGFIVFICYILYIQQWPMFIEINDVADMKEELIICLLIKLIDVRKKNVDHKAKSTSREHETPVVW